MTTEKTPLEIARETWPALAWARTDGSAEKADYYATWHGEGPGISVAFVVREGGKGWSVGTLADDVEGDDLAEVLVELRAKLAVQHRAALALCETSPADRFTCDRFTSEADPATGVTVRYDVHREPERRWEVALADGRRKGCASLSGAVGAALACSSITTDQRRRLALSYADDVEWPSATARDDLTALGFDLASDATWAAVKRAADVGLQHLGDVLRTKDVAWAAVGDDVESFPVRVVFHAGEAVLLLTDDYTGTPVVIVASTVRSVEEWGERGYVLHRDYGADRGREVRESAADIRATLDRLQAERGGGE